jgi:LysM repeat protein
MFLYLILSDFLVMIRHWRTVMKKNVIFSLLIVVVCSLAVLGCGTPPAAAPAPVTAVPQGLVLDGATNHTVVRGDTLADIAATKYGGSNMYFFPLIRLANAGTVPDPDVIEVGTKLVLPDLQRNLDNVGANALIRADMLSVAAQYERQGKPNAASTLRSLATRISR